MNVSSQNILSQITLCLKIRWILIQMFDITINACTCREICRNIAVIHPTMKALMSAQNTRF